MESLKQKLNDKSHVSQKRFDLELEIYRELSKSLVEAYDTSNLLQPIMDNLPEKTDEKLKIMKKRDTEFAQAFNNFSKIRREDAPFYSKDVNSELEMISKSMSELHDLFTYRWFMESMRDFATSLKGMERNLELHETIKNKTDQVTNKIRDRLDNLSNQI